jgi:hypothetical protein
MDQDPNTNIQTIVETDDCFAYIAEEPDGENTYHLQINNVTLHFFNEEWQIALDFLRKVVQEFD